MNRNEFKKLIKECISELSEMNELMTESELLSRYGSVNLRMVSQHKMFNVFEGNASDGVELTVMISIDNPDIYAFKEDVEYTFSTLFTKADRVIASKGDNVLFKKMGEVGSVSKYSVPSSSAFTPDESGTSSATEEKPSPDDLMEVKKLKKFIKECISELSFKSKPTSAGFNIDINRLEDVEVSGVDKADYPDMVDAYVVAASYMGRELSDEEIAWVNDNHPEIAQDIARDKVVGAR